MTFTPKPDDAIQVGRGLPDLSGLEALLHPYVGSAAYIIELADEKGHAIGNNGDQLMGRIFSRILEGLGICRVKEASEAEFLILPPNGALLQNYGFPALLTERLKELPDLPLVIFPSSAFFPSNDPTSILGQRKAATLWILREKYSFDHLKDRWGQQLSRRGVDLQMDHDVVASGHRYLSDVMRGPVTSSTVLVAARNDREASPAAMFRQGVRSNAMRQRLRSVAAERVVGAAWATSGVRMVRAGRHRSMGQELLGVAQVDEWIQQRDETARHVYCDVSATQFATFGYYSRQIRQSALVITNRLHVGLPAAALGKRVVLVEGGYHKLRGVYEQSLSTLENVVIIGSSR